MKILFKKLAAVLGVAALVMGQGGIIQAHAAEPAISAQINLFSATEVTWKKDGTGVFYNPNDCGVQVRVNVYTPGGQTLIYNPGSEEFPANNWIQLPLYHCFIESGRYTYDVTFISGENEVLSEISTGYQYDKPESKLPAPNFQVSAEGFITCDLSNLSGYQLGTDYGFNYILYGCNSSGEVKEKYQQGADSPTYDFGDKLKSDYIYYVQVKVISRNISKYADSDWSDFVPVDPANVLPSLNVPDNLEESEKSAVEKACAHEYEWVTERDATAITNGEAIYQCKYCGDVKERMEMANSAYAKFNKDAIKSIDKAPANGTVTIKTDMWVSFYASVIATLKSRPDVTVVLNYFYQGTRYTMTIPAGADLSGLVESEGYYGFRYLDVFFPGQEVK